MCQNLTHFIVSTWLFIFSSTNYLQPDTNNCNITMHIQVVDFRYTNVYKCDMVNINVPLRFWNNTAYRPNAKFGGTFSFNCCASENSTKHIIFHMPVYKSVASTVPSRKHPSEYIRRTEGIPSLQRAKKDPLT